MCMWLPFPLLFLKLCVIVLNAKILAFECSPLQDCYNPLAQQLPLTRHPVSSHSTLSKLFPFYLTLPSFTVLLQIIDIHSLFLMPLIQAVEQFTPLILPLFCMVQCTVLYQQYCRKGGYATKYHCYLSLLLSMLPL